jgi:hypothetical protein
VHNRLIDTIITCTVRWVQLPPALELLDQAIKKLNTTIQNAVKPFTPSPRRPRADSSTSIPTPRRAITAMKMEVEVQDQGRASEEDGAVHDHDSPSKVNFGCSESLVRRRRRRHQDSVLSVPIDPAGPSCSRKAKRRRGWACTRTTTGHKCISD